jgi:hypothetical protein
VIADHVNYTDPRSSQFVFDFNAGVGVARGAGGNITVANSQTFLSSLVRVCLSLSVTWRTSPYPPICLPSI